MIAFIEDNLGWVFTALIAGLIVGAAWSISAASKAREAFIAECVADGKKNYECVAMWRAGEKPTQVVPIPVVIPAR